MAAAHLKGPAVNAPRLREDQDYQAAGCDGKQPFRSYSSAVTASSRNARNPYRCAFCGNWHVSGISAKRRRA
jgi:hypothetical protein